MLQTIRAIRLGHVLLDENQELIILCHNCHVDLRNENEFRRHLEKCEGVENLFRGERQQLKFNAEKNSTQLFSKTPKGIKEFLIYDFSDVEFSRNEEHFIDLINIEHELLDPKWYSDFSPEVNNTTQKQSKQPYDVLVEEVTPFVQFKENVKNNNRISGDVSSNESKEVRASIKSVDLTSRKDKPIKRRLSVVKYNNDSRIDNNYLVNSSEIAIAKRSKVKNSMELNGTSNKPVLPKPSPCSLTSISGQISVCTPKPAGQPSIPISSPTGKVKAHLPVNPVNQPTKETAKILNKLQNLGLQIKRTASQAPPFRLNKTDDKTLEIINKLQSKGMKVKLVNNKPRTEEAPTDIGNNVTIKQNFHKNLIIRKVN